VVNALTLIDTMTAVCSDPK